MDEEVEDTVDDLKYTDSQKSVTTSNLYSPDFTDSSSDKNISSSKETYVIEQTDSDSDKTYQVHSDESIIKLDYKSKNHAINIKAANDKINKAVSTSLQRCTILGEEMCTQTSKTIFELTRNEILIQYNKENKTLETQTSFTSVETSNVQCVIDLTKNKPIRNELNLQEIVCNKDPSIDVHNNHVGFLKNKSPAIKSPNTNRAPNDNMNNYDDNYITFINDEVNDNMSGELYYETNETNEQNPSDVESWNINSDIDEDSLMENKHEKSKSNYDNHSEKSDNLELVEDDVQQLYQKITESTFTPQPIQHSIENEVHNLGTLTPVTEETNKNESLLDITPNIPCHATNTTTEIKHEPVANCSRMRSFMTETKTKENTIKLPPICKNQSCPNSPLVNSIFSVHAPQLPFYKPNALPDLSEKQRITLDRWELESKNLASGESHFINKDSMASFRSSLPVQLPPIYVEVGYKYNAKTDTPPKAVEEINIKERIRDLKMSNNKQRERLDRSCSPVSNVSPGEITLCEAAEKGCDALCSELLRRLRSSTWTEVTETLQYLPKPLDNFWSIISENRIADILRQLTSLVESPRTQVAQSACNALSQVLKNTSYNKRPEFYEAVSVLLTKTSSFNRPVRRAANMALDDIVCHVDLTHAVTAICIYGIEHKSPLVRCASTRLLVVCCALAEGGRQLLRSRPPTAAAARRHALRALATLLQDKNVDTRKYAERLYIMLRPLNNFEAFFLSDVEVEQATQLMKKYDQLLNNKKNS